MAKKKPSKRVPPPQEPRPWRSILEPHQPLIWSMRQQGKTYREIAEALVPHGLKVSHTAVFKFVRARKRRILASRLPEPLAQADAPLKPFDAPEAVKTQAAGPSSRTAEEAARIAAVKAELAAKQKAKAAAPAKRGFLGDDFDPTKPLIP